ncbi:disulfide bond formation protein B [Sphingopyxis sp. OPL5]|uniref:disulfide bond formation protein B n=1 Tax=Sphingopyxis sp. OPL5 TaxID=2486273 RepID=UPI0008CD1070|nr:disulfide bond formation protein B [Sphingopyxis sp. OPL5]OHC99880.1 MAG: disulfide bond formation protein [Sphingopyxis sp. RIFCSPHIGHO2_01_FULL_65_24]QNO25987.1 disulfide bond formation protein B [Sphingopyxis sp. OPL5]
MLNSRIAAPLVALAAPLLLYGGALVSQYGFGLHPCEMCYWQRWPHQAAIVLALLALLLRRNEAAMRALTLLAAVAIAISGAIGIFHAGVEYGWWQGLTTCSSTGSGPVTLDSIMAAPIVRCDVPQWTLGPISLAGFNAIFSLAAAAFVLTLLRRRPTSVA